MRESFEVIKIFTSSIPPGVPDVEWDGRVAVSIPVIFEPREFLPIDERT